jgi:hypothetical protein
MNNPKLNNLTEQLRQAHLTESEKTELREKLLTFMSAHPAPANAAPSGFWLLRQRSLSFSLTLALILIVTVSSVSYAAEFSLPGEPLYGLKVNLTEPLRGTLKNNPQAQAEWNNTLVERRLTEAQILADTGHLAGEAEAEIARRLEAQSDRARSSVEQVSTHDTLTAAELNARLEATLQVGQEILAARPRQPTNTSGQLHQSLDAQASSTQALSIKLESDWQKKGDKKDLDQHTAELRQRLLTEQAKLTQPESTKRSKNENHQEAERKLQQAQALLAAPTTTATSLPDNQSSIRQLQQAFKLEREAQLLNKTQKTQRKNTIQPAERETKEKNSRNNHDAEEKSSENSRQN